MNNGVLAPKLREINAVLDQLDVQFIGCILITMTTLVISVTFGLMVWHFDAHIVVETVFWCVMFEAFTNFLKFLRNFQHLVEVSFYIFILGLKTRKKRN